MQAQAAESSGYAEEFCCVLEEKISDSLSRSLHFKTCSPEYTPTGSSETRMDIGLSLVYA
jgi:hypothetical protein